MSSTAYQRHVPGMDSGPVREMIMFSHQEQQNSAKSESAGRPIFDIIEMVEIRFPGNNLTVISREVKAEDKERWPRHYEAFKKGAADVLVEGTPLKAWPALNRAQVAEFNALNIYSVEQLANVDDQFVQRIGMGGQMWRQRARDFLEAAEDVAHVDQLSAQNQRYAEQVQTQNAQLAEQREMIDRLHNQLLALQQQVTERTIPSLPDVGALAAPGFPKGEAIAGALAGGESYVAPKRMARKAAA